MVLERKGLSRQKVEFRPTSGNAIKLPLSVHSKTGNICWFVDRDTLQPIERMEYLLEIQQLPAACIRRIVPEEYRTGLRRHSEHETADADKSPATQSDLERLEEPGTRHNRMRDIAVHMRLTNHNRLQCQTALKNWYAKQDKSKIHSTPEMVMVDIENILDWVFSDKFKAGPQLNKGYIKLTQTDAETVISASNRSQRRVFFLLLVCSASGQRALSIAEIATITAVSKKTVSAAISRLRQDKKIYCESGGRILTSEGYFVGMRNQYSVSQDFSRRLQPRQAFSISEVKCSFDTEYHRFLSMAPQTVLNEKLSRTERMEYQEQACLTLEKQLQLIDACAENHILQHEVFGQMVIYEYKGEFLFPIVDVLRCMGIKNPESSMRRYASRQTWYTKIGNRKVKKCFIDAYNLRLILMRSRSDHKEALARWLLDGRY